MTDQEKEFKNDHGIERIKEQIQMLHERLENVEGMLSQINTSQMSRLMLQVENLKVVIDQLDARTR